MPGHRLSLILIFLLLSPCLVQGQTTVEEVRAELRRKALAWNVPDIHWVMLRRDSLRGPDRMEGSGGNVSGLPAASLDKPLIALGLRKLIRDGVLRADAPVRELLPPGLYENPWEETHPLLLIHLLEHRSGFDDLHPDEYFCTSPVPLREALLTHADARICRWAPGSRPSYSNHNYLLAARILEEKTGMAWQDWLGRQFPQVGPVRLATQPRAGEGPVNLIARKRNCYCFPSAMGYAAGMDEMQGLLHLLAADSSLWVPDWYRPQTGPLAAHGITEGFVPGFYREDAGGRIRLRQRGDVLGHTAWLAWFPQTREGFFVYAARDRAPIEEAAALLEKLLLPTAAPAWPPAVPGVKPGWEGVYAFENPRNEVLALADYWTADAYLKRVNDTLITLETLGKKLYYRHLGNGLFADEKGRVPRLTLYEDGDRLHLQSGTHAWRQTNPVTESWVLQGKPWVLGVCWGLSAVCLILFVWGLARGWGRFAKAGFFWAGQPWLAFQLGIWLWAGAGWWQWTEFNMLTLGIFLCSLWVLFGTVANLWAVLQVWGRFENRWALVWLLVMLTFNTSLCIFLGNFGLLFLRLWSW